MQISFIIDIQLSSKYVSDYGQTQKHSSKDILKIFKILICILKKKGKTLDADLE